MEKCRNSSAIQQFALSSLDGQRGDAEMFTSSAEFPIVLIIFWEELRLNQKK